MSGPRTRILLVDDQELIRRGMRMVFDAEDDLRVVDEAGSGPEAIARAAAQRPDVVVMDVRMPGMDGIEATRHIVADTPRSRVLILTTFDLDEYAFGGLRAGASGFLVKDTPPEQLVAAVRAVAAGDALVSPRVTRSLLDLFATRLPADAAARPAAVAELSQRELEVFVAVGRGLNNSEITTALTISESTVKTHVGRVLTKLGLRDRVQAVVLAHELGLV